MSTSQIVTVSDNNGVITATTQKAEAFDMLTTVFSTNSALTGVLALGQRAGLVVAGMAVQSKLKNNTFNFLKN